LISTRGRAGNRLTRSRCQPAALSALTRDSQSTAVLATLTLSLQLYEKNDPKAPSTQLYCGPKNLFQQGNQKVLQFRLRHRRFSNSLKGRGAVSGTVGRRPDPLKKRCWKGPKTRKNCIATSFISPGAFIRGRNTILLPIWQPFGTHLAPIWHPTLVAHLVQNVTK